jgi:hypothetical protein
MGKEFQKGKSFTGHFPLRWPAAAHYLMRASVVGSQDPPVGPSSPKSSLATRSLALPQRFPPLRRPPVMTPAPWGCPHVHLPPWVIALAVVHCGVTSPLSAVATPVGFWRQPLDDDTLVQQALLAKLSPPRLLRSPARHVGGDMGCPRAALWATPGQAAPHHRWAAQATRTVRVGRSCGFRPMDNFLNRNHFLFILNSF